MEKTEQQKENEMSRNDMLDEIFEATCKLELISTVAGDLINTVECNVNSPEDAMFFAANQNKLSDFLHIILDGLNYSTKILNGLQKQ